MTKHRIIHMMRTSVNIIENICASHLFQIIKVIGTYYIHTNVSSHTFHKVTHRHKHLVFVKHHQKNQIIINTSTTQNALSKVHWNIIKVIHM